MTEEELKDVLSPQGEPSLIVADAMRDVAFWPMSINITPTHYELTGIWYSEMLKGFMGHSNGDPLRETIKIKKEDLVRWKKRTKNQD